MNPATLAKPKPALNCFECGRAGTMKLQHAGQQPHHGPLLYICYACGATHKIAPPPTSASSSNLPLK